MAMSPNEIMQTILAQTGPPSMKLLRVVSKSGRQFRGLLTGFNSYNGSVHFDFIDVDTDNLKRLGLADIDSVEVQV